MEVTAKYAVPDQIKLRMLELSIRRNQSDFSTVYIFDRLVSAAAQFCNLGQCMQWRQANHFFFFSIFELLQDAIFNNQHARIAQATILKNTSCKPRSGHETHTEGD